MGYLRTDKFNVTELERESAWKTAWFKALCPGTLAMGHATGVRATTGADCGLAVDRMLASVYGLYRFLPDVMSGDLAGMDTASMQEYMVRQCDVVLDGCPEYMSNLRQLMESEMLAAWGEFYREWQDTADTPVRVDVSSFRMDDKDAFVSDCVLAALSDGRPEDLESACGVAMPAVRDGLVRRNRHVAHVYREPWVQVRFPEPADMAAMGIWLGMPDGDAFIGEAIALPCMRPLKPGQRRDYKAALARAMHLMSGSDRIRNGILAMTR